MKRNWINTQDVIAIAVTAILSFFIESTLGLFLIPIIPIPLVGGLLSALFDAMIIFLANYLVPRKGGALLFATILLSLSTITPSFGPPGFYKVFIGIALGGTLEIVLLATGRSYKAYIFATAIAFGLSIPMTYLAWKYFGIPTEKLQPYLWKFTGIYAFMGFVGSFIAYRYIYLNRLSKFEIIRKTRGETE